MKIETEVKMIKKLVGAVILLTFADFIPAGEYSKLIGLIGLA